MRYAVLTNTTGGWCDVWKDNGRAQRFATKAEAQTEIDDLLSEMPDYSAEDYKIIEM